jgi:hydrogenase maturation factor HypF (carbamoyltransferase family)
VKSARSSSKRKESSNSVSKQKARLCMFLIPCSCGTTFAVADDYDRQGTAWSRYLICPGCGKRHDPKNRLLQMGYHPEGYWRVDKC